MVLVSSGGCREEMSECPGALSTITVQTRRTTALQMNADLGFQIPAASLLPSLLSLAELLPLTECLLFVTCKGSNAFLTVVMKCP